MKRILFSAIVLTLITTACFANSAPVVSNVSVSFSMDANKTVTVNYASNPPVPADMVSIPAGTFQMGNSEGEGHSSELPVHTVTLSSFFMGKYDITNGQYCQYLNSALGQGLITVTSGVVYKAGSGTSYPYCNTSAYAYRQIAYSGGVFSVLTKGSRSMANDPMVDVSWYGAVAYCNWRSQQEGKTPCYNLSTWVFCDFTQNGYHLPTEAQWEYAARGGLSGQRFPWGDTISQTQANFMSLYKLDDVPVKVISHPLWSDGIYPCTSPIGFFDGTMKYQSDFDWEGSETSYQTTNGVNGYGLYDMAGNVWQWCNDWSGSYSSSPQTNPTGPTSGSHLVIRGGSWNLTADDCRVSCRGGCAPNGWFGNEYGNTGFRVCLDL